MSLLFRWQTQVRGRGIKGHGRRRRRVSTTPEVSSTPSTPSVAGSSVALDPGVGASDAPASSTQLTEQQSRTVVANDLNERKTWLAPGDVHFE